MRSSPDDTGNSAKIILNSQGLSFRRQPCLRLARKNASQFENISLIVVGAGGTGELGFKPSNANSQVTQSSKLRHGEKSTGGNTGGREPENVNSDVNLQAVIDAWPRLPEPVKAGILAMVRASKS